MTQFSTIINASRLSNIFFNIVQIICDRGILGINTCGILGGPLHLDFKNNGTLQDGRLAWPLRYIMTSVLGNHFKIISDSNHNELQA
jgi:hypothetical protein